MLLAQHLFFIRLRKCLLVVLMWEKDNSHLQGFKLKVSAAVHFKGKTVHMVKINACYLSQWQCFCLVLWKSFRPSAIRSHNLSVVCRDKLVLLCSEKRLFTNPLTGDQIYVCHSDGLFAASVFPKANQMSSEKDTGNVNQLCFQLTWT